MEARLRNVHCMRASDHTRDPSPGACVLLGYSQIALTPDLTVRGRYPHSVGYLVKIGGNPKIHTRQKYTARHLVKSTP